MAVVELILLFYEVLYPKFERLEIRLFAVENMQ